VGEEAIVLEQLLHLEATLDGDVAGWRGGMGFEMEGGRRG
jgi:hypothetical protein